ncbi:sugar-transfer associated ATP-grasp domain-containing protein [Maribacter litoralis]|uniref:Sugar-transfer associated ATP-grasp n=1 Tax=Maribacter litoralis TaxID=2059726 RepID=A0A653SB80_9FLAO|nr:sugar-transfer associated ATP-grasp domain-containing protein [Maribacter litoralis]VXB65390.1 Sugar-transfer associated ATP-grasp [Maribacter litoralis]
MIPTEPIKNSIKKYYSSFLDSRYHFISNRQALKALKHIEKQKGKLPIQLKKEVRQYAQETLGWKGYAPWLLVYTAICGKFKKGWIPDNYYRVVITPKLQGEYGKVSFLKSLTKPLFQTDTLVDIAYFINTDWFDHNYKKLSTPQVEKLIGKQTNKIVFKADNSFQGKGVKVFNTEDLNLKTIQNIGNGTIQQFIEQHDFFNQFQTNSTATIRLTTVIDKTGTASLRAGYLRLGRTRDTHISSKTHIRVPIDIAEGTLEEVGYLPNWYTITNHPDSKIEFKDKTIPNFKTCVEEVKKLHLKLPMVQCIGWDVIIDKHSQMVLMEWNGYGNDIKFSEATQGPCFKDLGWID